MVPLVCFLSEENYLGLLLEPEDDSWALKFPLFSKIVFLSRMVEGTRLKSELIGAVTLALLFV